MRVLVGLAIAVCVLAPVGSAGSAGAGSRTSGGSTARGTGGGSGSGSGGLGAGAITAGVQFGTPPAEGTADRSGCTWVAASVFQNFELLVVTEKTVDGVLYVLFYRSCPTSGQGIWVAQLASSGLALNAANAVRQLLPKPTVHSAPSMGNGIVKVGMWLWTDPTQYRSMSATAWVPTGNGIAWATTTATPVRLVFLSGEPGASPMSCPGPGHAWLPQFGDEMVSACMYTYQHSSEITARQAFDATLSIVWSVRWRSNVGIGGNLGEYATSTNQPITVNEIQAVVSN